jgi:tRNA(Arg) A34 adenosine deaminase TadA
MGNKKGIIFQVGSVTVIIALLLAGGCASSKGILPAEKITQGERAIAEARQSRQEGNKGYGAVVALGNRVLAQAHDTAARDRDPSLHAEVNAIRLAVRALGDGDLCGAVLVSTCEPCPMCASLAVWANLTPIVFGASITDTAARGRTRILVPAAAIIARGPTIIDVVPAVLADECLALYS